MEDLTPIRQLTLAKLDEMETGDWRESGEGRRVIRELRDFLERTRPATSHVPQPDHANLWELRIDQPMVIMCDHQHEPMLTLTVRALIPATVGGLLHPGGALMQISAHPRLIGE